MKKLFLLISLLSAAWSATYDPFLLETQLSLLPKIVLLEKNAVSANKKSPFKILIAYDGGDTETAQLCMKILNKKYNGTINGKPLQITVLPVEKVSAMSQYHLVYALKMSSTQLEKLRIATDSAGTVTALYDAPKLLSEGYLLSILLERNPVILVNAKALKKSSVTFPDHLLEMARIIE